jgi:phosphoglucomutase
LEHLISLTKKGMRGQEEIAEMMQDYRNSLPTTINGSKVVQLLDYQLQIGKNLQTKEAWSITLPKSNVLQFILDDGTKISARPSGTEPKIKFYFSVNTKLNRKEEYESTRAMLEARIKGVIEDMKLK